MRPLRSVDAAHRGEANVTNGYDRADWTVEMTGQAEGFVSCGTCRARFDLLDIGTIRIVWPPMAPMADVRTFQRIARDVVENAIREHKV